MIRKILPFAVLATLAAGNANALIIDNFNDGDYALTVVGPNLLNPLPQSSGYYNTAITGVVGGSRVLSITNHSGPAGGITAEVVAGEYAHSNSANRLGTSTILWDNNAGLLGGADLTDGGLSTALNLAITSIDQGNVSLTFDITDSDGDIATLVLSGLGVAVHSFVFTSFLNYANTDFTSVDSILLTVQAGLNSDLTLDLVETNTFTPPGVPEPATLSLLGAGLAAMAARRRRKA